MLMYMLYNVACILEFGFGAYTFIIALTEDIKINLNAINDKTQTKADRVSIIKEFSGFIKIHSRARQLSASEIFNFIAVLSFIMEVLQWAD